jgi:hypothetical protein
MKSDNHQRHPLRRSAPGPSWAAVQSAHPGVRDPRSTRVGDWPPLVNGLIITACVFVTIFSIASAWTASPVGTPTSWQQWGEASSPLRLEYPSGWSVQELGSGDQVHVVVMRSRWVRIHIIADANIAGAAAALRRADGAQDAPFTAVETIHRETLSTWKSFFGSMRESESARTRINRWPAVWSQFQYDGATVENAQQMTGYRATITAPAMGAIASAVAPTAYSREFRPIALHVLRSIQLDAGE